MNVARDTSRFFLAATFCLTAAYALDARAGTSHTCGGTDRQVVGGNGAEGCLSNCRKPGPGGGGWVCAPPNEGYCGDHSPCGHCPDDSPRRSSSGGSSGGSSSSSASSTCSDGYIDTDASASRAYCVACPDGQGPNSAKSQCATCAKNQASVRPPGGGHNCVTCSPGQRPNSDRTNCENCPAGSASDGGTCIACSGDAKPKADKSACVCPKDQAITVTGTTARCVKVPTSPANSRGTRPGETEATPKRPR